MATSSGCGRRRAVRRPRELVKPRAGAFALCFSSAIVGGWRPSEGSGPKNWRRWSDRIDTLTPQGSRQHRRRARARGAWLPDRRQVLPTVRRVSPPDCRPCRRLGEGKNPAKPDGVTAPEVSRGPVVSRDGDATSWLWCEVPYHHPRGSVVPAKRAQSRQSPRYAAERAVFWFILWFVAAVR
jgi:hypothetical protein